MYGDFCIDVMRSSNNNIIILIIITTTTTTTTTTGLGVEDVLIHYLNLVWPNIFEGK